MKKRVEVSSVDSRVFVKEVLALGKSGATLPDDSGVFKGIMLRTTLEVDESVLVTENKNVRVIPNDKGRLQDNVREEVKKTTRRTAAKKENVESNSSSEKQDKE